MLAVMLANYTLNTSMDHLWDLRERTLEYVHSMDGVGIPIHLSLEIQIPPEEVFLDIFWGSKYLLSRCLDV